MSALWGAGTRVRPPTSRLPASRTAIGYSMWVRGPESLAAATRPPRSLLSDRNFETHRVGAEDVRCRTFPLSFVPTILATIVNDACLKPARPYPAPDQYRRVAAAFSMCCPTNTAASRVTNSVPAAQCSIWSIRGMSPGCASEIGTPRPGSALSAWGPF
jgi:hypothetical protein